MHPLQKPQPERTKRSIVFITFESEAAHVGGLGAVMKILPKRIANVENDCFIIAPYFKNITPHQEPHIANELHSTMLQFDVPFENRIYSVEIWEHVNQQGFRTYLLDTPEFFNAPDNPYLNPDNPDLLLHDALFFCTAVPYSFKCLGKIANLLLVLQDWETACVALTAIENPEITSMASCLVLHNFYDKPLSVSDFSKISQSQLLGPTVLSKMIPLLNGPVYTVSENFATELTNDLLHTEIYAPHLQSQFKEKGVVGINNGVFEPLDFPEKAIEAALNGNFQPLLTEKQIRRARLIEVIKEQSDNQTWGNLDWSNFNGPIFLMFGRDDPCQKGYDLASAAIAQIPKGAAKYIFTPIPGDEGLKGLAFLKRLAQDRQGEVIVFPHRLSAGYKALQQGSSFAIMSSFYEPFGGATEAYAVGTPVVARATGGLLQQVVPYPSACLDNKLNDLIAQFHMFGAKPSGFLFRERALSEAEIVAGWRTVVDRTYWPNQDRIVSRTGNQLYNAMISATYQALLDAIMLFNNNPADYARMILGGFEILKRFSWDDTVVQYRLAFDHVCS